MTITKGTRVFYSGHAAADTDGCGIGTATCQPLYVNGWVVYVQFRKGYPATLPFDDLRPLTPAEAAAWEAAG